MRTSPLLDRYKGIVDESQIEQIYEVVRSLAGLHVLHVNTTAHPTPSAQQLPAKNLLLKGNSLLKGEM